MNILYLVSYFFGDALPVNTVPHLVSALRGEPLWTPFVNPPRSGLSSSTVNLIWGFANFSIGYALVCRGGAFDLGATAAASGFCALALGLYLARHCGTLHGGNDPKRGQP